MATRRCPDCGRELREPQHSEDEMLRELFRRTSWVCMWCFDVKLLAGKFEPPRLEERWSDTDLVALRRAAVIARGELVLRGRQKTLLRLRKQQEKTQETMVSAEPEPAQVALV